MTQTHIAREIIRRRNALGLSQRELSKRAGVNETWVKKVENGTVESPRGANLVKVAKVLGCTVSDLTGEHSTVDDGGVYVDHFDTSTQPQSMAVLMIEELETRVHAGAGALVDGHSVVGQWQIPAAVVRGFTSTTESDLKLIPVVGDSMMPTLHPGQRLMVDTTDKTPSPPGIFVLWDGLGFVVKRVEVVPHSDPITVRISSDNPRYTPYERTLDEAYIQGRVIGGWNWL
jgi:transcriptional regulator with XRE-family HTH domain